MLHIWLPSQHSELYVWDDTHKLWQRHDNWQSIADGLETSGLKKTGGKTGAVKADVCLYFPSRNILQVDSDLTSAQLKQLGETGKKYLFEDMSLNSVEQLQVRQIEEAGHQYLYAVSQNDIDQWLQSASLVGMDIQALLPDFLLLKAVAGQTGQAYLYHDEHTTLLRQSEANGTAVSFLPLIVNQLGLVDEVIVYQSLDNDSNHNASIEEVTNTLSSLNVLYSLTESTPQPVSNANRHSLNYLVKTSKNKLSPYLKVALLMVVLGLFTQIIADGLTFNKLKNANKATISATKKQFKAWYPEERLNTRTSIKAQLEPKLKSKGQTDTAMMSLFSQISPLIKQSALTANNILIDSDSINLELQASNRRQLDGFVNKLQQQGIEAQLGSLRSLDNLNSSKKFTGTVSIRSVAKN